MSITMDIAMPTAIDINLCRIGRLAFYAAIANLRVKVKAVGDPFLDLIGVWHTR